MQIERNANKIITLQTGVTLGYFGGFVAVKIKNL
jgi:hypothetical protein